MDATNRKLQGRLVVSAVVFLAAAWLDQKGLADTSPVNERVILTHDECRRLALEKQPSLAAHRASLAAAETQARALRSLRVPVFLRPDLPVRRRQADLGVGIASAGVFQAEWDTVYVVTRTFLGVRYARAQLQVAGEVVAHLKNYRQSVAEAVKAGTGQRDWNERTVDKISTYLGLAEVREAEGRRGLDLALAALREAMGIGPEVCFDVGEGLPLLPQREFCKADLIAQAISRRGEAVQAALLAEVTCLEQNAQARRLWPVQQTYAANADIHSRPIPAGEADGNYRPAALAPEMPSHLSGSRCFRVQRASIYASRAEAVAEKARNLIALEIEDYLLKYREATEKLTQTRNAAEAAERLARATREDFNAKLNVRMEDLLTNEILMGQARAQVNEAIYQQGLALAGLERATAGVVCFDPVAYQPVVRPLNDVTPKAQEGRP